MTALRPYQAELFPKPHPRPAAVLGDELDAGSFEGKPSFLHRIRADSLTYGNPRADAEKALQGLHRNARGFSKSGLRQVQHRQRSAQL